MSKMSIDVKLKVTEIQRFCMHDGPGVRTTVFLKGCPLRCAWCHNPETQKAAPELLFYPNKCIGCGGCAAVCKQGAHSMGEAHRLDREKCAACFDCESICPTGALERCGKDLSVDEILSTVERDQAFYGQTGGITLSGGEPFLQGEALIVLLKAAKARGLTTAVETCGYADPDVLRAAAPFVDLFLWDVKDTDEARHRRYTGVSNKEIQSNLALIDALGARTRLRCILVNGVNTDPAHYERIAALALSLQNCEGVELLPYHAYGGSKSELIGLADNGRAEWIPTAEQFNEAKTVLKKNGVRHSTQSTDTK